MATNKTPAGKKVGRPSDYAPELAAQICEHIAKGMSLHEICDQDGMPGTSAVCVWLSRHKDFAEQYARAREIQGDLMDRLIMEAAGAPAERVVLRPGSDPQVDPGEVQHRRLKIDALKWRAAHLRPKVYGVQKQEVEHSGTLSLEQILAVASKPDEAKK